MTVEDDIYYMAMSVCDYNYVKAQDLIKLISVLTRPKCKMPDVKMNLPEAKCVWYKDNKCWIDMPDSKRECSGNCKNFEEEVNE